MNKTTKSKVTTDELMVEVSDPYSSTGHKMKLRIQGDVVDSGNYTNAIHAHVKGLIEKLNQIGVHIWEFRVDKLIVRPEMCECGRSKKGNVNDLTVAFRVESGISGGGTWLMIDFLGWMLIGVRRDNEHKSNDVWFYLKRVIHNV